MRFGGLGVKASWELYMRHMARQAEEFRKTALVPCWADGTAGVWWRWVGHVGSASGLGGLRVRVAALWRDAWQRKKR